MKAQTSLIMDFSVDKENRKIFVKREFAAPLTKVWAAWTDSKLLDQWWAPKPWQAQTKSMDFREGGTWIYAMVGPDGTTHWSRADFHSIIPYISYTGEDAFCDENGNIDPNLPKSVWSNEFQETGDSTTVFIAITYEKESDLEKILEMGFKEGLTSAMENLDELLA